MSVRIRVYPGGMAGGAYGANAYAAQNQLAQQQLKNTQDTSDLRLQYERALWSEKLKEAELTSAIKYGATTQAVAPIGIGAGLGGLLGAGMLGGMMGGFGGLGGMIPGGFGAAVPTAGVVPNGFAGAGQSNLTTQASAGAATQSVTNANNYTAYTAASPFGYGGYPYGGYGYHQGGFLGNLLRGIF